jgi:pyruvate/2-oxoglutarate/acetoin dehydrogenase E1 component/TPP-dependent pyruvate/acetoin dehydrogenase alpha subunit
MEVLETKMFPETARETTFARVPRGAPPLQLTREAILEDYRLAVLSRQLSVVGRREVLSGNAKFGIFGDGKELAQLALAKVFQPGDFRSGYYRDQTLLLALGMLTPAEFFAQLYAHADVVAEPASAGRAMVNHPATRLLDERGQWRPQVAMPNTTADISPTAGQMPRLVGLAYASRLYRELEELHQFTQFSHNGDEVAFGTIGNASCAEGLFWEALNAIGVLRVPAVISIWDDEYGISVTNEHQITKGNLSALLAGFRRGPGSEQGFNLYTVRGWDYRGQIAVYEQATRQAREQHIPAIVHVIELTQPLGHSTSGSQERYKSPDRLAWEAERDPIKKLREWMLAERIATEAELDELEARTGREVEAIREQAWAAVNAPLRAEAHELAGLLNQAARHSTHSDALHALARELAGTPKPLRRQMQAALRAALVRTRGEASPARSALLDWQAAQRACNHERYGSHLYSQSEQSALRVPAAPPIYAAESRAARGFEVLQANFDAWLTRDPRVFIFGEDVGGLGDVNQGTAGLQARHGKLRIADTGIREATIVGQAIGMALRGLRPIAEIQYLDYILYAMPTLSDDLACLRWRTRGGQKAPAIIRTRGHRLEGIWHAGSPMGALLHTLRGMHILVPRDMTRAAGFYNTLLRSDDPALVVEVLNGYRLAEPMPANLGDFTVPLGVPEILRPGDDVTLVTYGACCRIALEAAEALEQLGIDVEVVDVQSLLPFDVHHAILASLKKTGRIVFLDEDMPGGASAYMLQQVLEAQGGYWQLDSPPRTITAQPHRPAYGSDGDYFSKPNADDVFEAIYGLMHEADPASYPAL